MRLTVALAVLVRGVLVNVMFRDSSLPHQLVVKLGARYQIVVACNCGAVLGSQYHWADPGEPARLWRAHMAGIAGAE